MPCEHTVTNATHHYGHINNKLYCMRKVCSSKGSNGSKCLEPQCEESPQKDLIIVLKPDIYFYLQFWQDSAINPIKTTNPVFVSKNVSQRLHYVFFIEAITYLFMWNQVHKREKERERNRKVGVRV